MRPNLLISGIFNLIVGAIWVMAGKVENNFTLAIGAFILVAGVIFIMYSRLPIQELYGKRSTILTLAIFLLPFSFISAVISIIDFDLIKRDYAKYRQFNNIQDSETQTQKTSVSKETKKIDILLKIGVVMVALAGIMIVTTSWETITDIVKLVLLIIIGIVFFGLFKFSEIKLKIRNTTIAYWLLSMISLALACFLVGYGEMLGDWFCFGGSGEDVFTAALLLIIATMLYITYKKFSITSFAYLSYIALTSSALFLLRQLGQTPEICVLIIASILLIINILPKTEKKEIKIIKNFSMIITYVLTAFVLAELKDITENVIVFANLIVQIASLIALGLREKTDVAKLLTSLSVIALATVATSYLLTDLERVYSLMITRSIFILLAIFICAVIIRDSKISNIFLGITMPIVLLSIIFEINIIIAIYVGCISLVMLIFGAIKKEFKVIFVEGIIFTILNIIIQLGSLWGQIPVSVYLLVGGLVLIGIVTVKEIRKGKSSEENVIVENKETVAEVQQPSEPEVVEIKKDNEQ